METQGKRQWKRKAVETQGKGSVLVETPGKRQCLTRLGQHGGEDRREDLLDELLAPERDAEPCATPPETPNQLASSCKTPGLWYVDAGFRGERADHEAGDEDSAHPVRDPMLLRQALAGPANCPGREEHLQPEPGGLSMLLLESLWKQCSPPGARAHPGSQPADVRGLPEGRRRDGRAGASEDLISPQPEVIRANMLAERM